MSTANTAKVDRDGNVRWSSRFIGYNNLAYHMVHADSRKNEYREIEHIQVRRVPDGKGWQVLHYGDRVFPPEGEISSKNRAQREAEKLIDNPRDDHGYPLPA